MYHAEVWHSEYQSPMVVTNIGHIYANDFITFYHDTFGLTIGKVTKLYCKVSVCRHSIKHK